ncbi:7945_t:CDS:2 [Funneliformis geosporum]|uniref:7945_t:CDS:1 n=1 Tax=Funneliformis geosporum TaxID=1117311 RepID=A0A9W4T0J4_9GLOM|nr:7945_t:CDS:2 [Funneliformis geosporum]
MIILQISTTKCFQLPHLKRQLTTKSKRSNSFIKKEKADTKMRFGIQCNLDDIFLCKKIIKATENVGTLISSVILFNEPLIVNVIIEEGCVEDLCPYDGDILEDSGILRLYPQPLAKQFFKNHPDYDDIDILVNFSLQSNYSYWFQGDPLPTDNTTIIDFSYMMLHEIIHSLGFFSSWGIWFEQVDEEIPYITPQPRCVNLDDDECGEIVSKDLWTGFYEFVFDKYLMDLNTGGKLSDKTAQLNKFFGPNGIPNKSENSIKKKFFNSSQFEIAKEMNVLATTSGTIGFLSWNDTDFSDCLVLETNINPFDNIVSLSHVDNKKYNNTSDFLMRNDLLLGRTLQRSIITGGNYTNGTLAGSIGPKLRKVLETLGYSTVDKPYTLQKLKIPNPRSINSGNHSTCIAICQKYLLRENHVQNLSCFTEIDSLTARWIGCSHYQRLNLIRILKDISVDVGSNGNEDYYSLQYITIQIIPSENFVGILILICRAKVLSLENKDEFVIERLYRSSSNSYLKQTQGFC